MFVRRWIRQGALALLLLFQVLTWGIAPAGARGEPPAQRAAAQQTATAAPETQNARRSTPAPARLPASARLPDLRMLPSQAVSLDAPRADGSQMLRFTTSIINAGMGPAELRGEKIGGEEFVVHQVIQTGEAESITVPLAGTFFYNTSHSHYHWQGFAAYEVWSVETGGALSRRMVANDKVGFCLFDSYRIGRAWLDENVSRDLPIPGNALYANCRFNRQGLSPGWVDVYRRVLEGQALDVSGLADGVYALVTTVNPDGVVYESNLENNSTVLYFAIHDNRLIQLGPEFDMLDYFTRLVENGIVKVVDGQVEAAE